MLSSGNETANIYVKKLFSL